MKVKNEPKPLSHVPCSISLGLLNPETAMPEQRREA